MKPVSIINRSMELSECAGSWEFDEEYNCWMLEDVLYTSKASVPKFQRLSIFVPKALMNSDGSPKPESKRVPVVFENNSAGYMQMPHTWLGGPRNYADQYLEHGLIYVTCGCRGRESRDENGKPVGKSPISLVDLKTAIRFLRHNSAVLPGDWDRIISVGWSAGGAMSSLLAVSGDNDVFAPFLEENGAFMEESDAVYAAQIYCPIVDLEHADLAYEWCFQKDKECEASPAGPAETMPPFKEALSAELSKRYIAYFNSLNLRNPESGEALFIGEDGRSGSAYSYLMEKLELSATDFLRRLDAGELPQKYSVEDYIAGNYTFMAPVSRPPKPNQDPNLHHAGPGEALPDLMGLPAKPMSLGDLVSRPPKGIPYHGFEPPMAETPGKDKRSWLTWDGMTAHISNLDDYVMNHRRRMKPCTSFDKLTMDSGENQLFGNERDDFVHFNSDILEALESISGQYPEEAKEFIPDYAGAVSNRELAEKIRLVNPLSFIGCGGESKQASHYRIRVGACDADTAFTVAMTLALKLENNNCGTVDYAIVWDQPHSEADYPGEVCKWIDSVCG